MTDIEWHFEYLKHITLCGGPGATALHQRGSSAPSGAGFGNHCLAKAGSEYIVYLQNGGAANLTVSGVSGQLTATWMNAYTGAEQGGTAATNGTYAATSPWSSTPSLLWLRGGITGVRPVAQRPVSAAHAPQYVYDVMGRRIAACSSVNRALPHGVYLVGSGAMLERAASVVR